jgi:hypothetical protein
MRKSAKHQIGRRAVHLVIAVLAALSSAGCDVPQRDTIGVWTQPDEHLVLDAPCGSHCRSYQGYEVTWDVLYPENLKLANFRVSCRNVRPGYPCVFDEDIYIADDSVDHKATVHWRHRASAVAVRLVADEIQ